MQCERYVCLEGATLEIPTGIAHKLRNVAGQLFEIFQQVWPQSNKLVLLAQAGLS